MGYSTPNFSRLGLAYGIKSFKIREDEFEIFCFNKINFNEPNIIEIMIDSNSKALPKTYFGSDMSNQQPNIEPKLFKNY